MSKSGKPKIEKRKLEIETRKPSPGGRKTKLSKGKPPIFHSLLGEPPAESVDNPLDGLQQTDDIQATADNEVSAMLQAILDERKRLRDQYRLAADTEYWVALCFQSREQKEQFLTALQWLEHGDKYLDGLLCARSLGIEIEPIPLPMREGTSKTPKSLRRMEVLR